jgi:hypothetical protein
MSCTDAGFLARYTITSAQYASKDLPDFVGVDDWGKWPL